MDPFPESIMKLHHFRYFVAVAEALSFNKAAEHLHPAKPLLTHQIKDLETEIGGGFLIAPKGDFINSARGNASSKRSHCCLPGPAVKRRR
jgi:hypothetical protein